MMNIEKADYWMIVKFGSLSDLLLKMEMDKDHIPEIIDRIDGEGLSLLERSIVSRKFDISQYLLEHNANVNIVSCDGNNEFHYLAANLRYEGALDVAYMLLDRGTSLMQKDFKYGNSAFFTLCSEAFKVRSEVIMEFIKECFSKVTDIDDTNKAGISIRQLVNDRGDDELKKMMEVK